MGRILLLIVASLFLVNLASAKNVKGYTKKKGTYVQPYYRSNPNNTKIDNYSTKGSVNPYTGAKGHK